MRNPEFLHNQSESSPELEPKQCLLDQLAVREASGIFEIPDDAAISWQEQRGDKTASQLQCDKCGGCIVMICQGRKIVEAQDPIGDWSVRKCPERTSLPLEA